MIIDFPPRLSLAQLPTPLIPLDRLSAMYQGPRIWLKRDDLTGANESGNKIRKLEFSLAHAVANGVTDIITCGGLQSNHCRATAILCARLGLNCHLILRGEPEAVYDGNLLIDHLCGAHIITVPVKQYVAEQQHLLMQCKTRIESQASPDGSKAKAFIIPTGASDGIGVWGYIAACPELALDFERLQIQPQAIICASGSGGTQAGLSLGAQAFGLGATVYGINVCDDAAYFERKARADMYDALRLFPQCFDAGVDLDLVPINTIDGYVGAGYAKASPEVFACIKQLARLEGIILDPVYTGKAFYGLLSEIEQGRFKDCKDIVFIHTGGSLGVFPYRQDLSLNY